MFVKLKRTAMSFGAVLVAFFVYRFVAVPFIEPRVQPRRVAAVSPEQLELIRANQLKNRLGGYLRFFPEGSWERDRPILLESETSKLLLKQYTNLPDGRVEISPCTVIYLPEGDAEAEGSRKRVVILRAEKAYVQFDSAVNLSRGELGKLLGGNLVGPVRIESGATRPEGGDDLLITTRDVQMIENRIATPHEVDFRFGASYGHGRGMRIDLLPSADASIKSRGPNIGGIQSFELASEVQMHLQPGSSGFFPGNRRQENAADNEKLVALAPKGSNRLGGSRSGAQPPVEIRCQGPFQFDMVTYIASFHDRVDVVSASPIGVSDQLNCELLSIFFAPRPPKAPLAGEGANAKKKAVAQAQSSQLPPLEPRRIEARGNPVVVNAPSNSLEARGDRLMYDLATGRIELDSATEVWMNQRASELRGATEARAKSFVYEPGPDGSPLGYLDSKGPGFIRASTRNDPTHPFEAHWSQKLTMLPQDGNHVISLRGQARASYSGSQLSAETIDVWLHQLSPQQIAERAAQTAATQNVGAAKGLRGSETLSGIVPVQMQADGGVQIESEQLSGTVRRLEVRFRDPDAPVAGPANAKSDAPRTRNPRAPDRATPVHPRNVVEKPHFEIKRGGLLQAWVLNGPRPDLENLVLKDDVCFVQSPSATDGDKPLEVIGDEVNVLRANLPTLEMAVMGRPAQVGGRGLTMFGQAVQLDAAANRLWINGAGRMTFADNRLKPNSTSNDAAQTPIAEGERKPISSAMSIDFQGGMNFDGLTARFERDVLGTRVEESLEKDSKVHVTQIIRTPNAMEVTLRDRIDFAAARERRPDERPQPAFISALGNVFLENRELKDGHPAALEQFEVIDLKINQLTGELSGQGPGQLHSWRLGDSATGMFRPNVVPASATKERADANQINYLEVQFQRDVSGNVLRREMSFQDQVRSTYGPVEAWDKRIDADSPQGLPPQGMLLTCDQLGVNEAGPRTSSRLGPVEMKASGNVRVEGQGETNEMFFAQAMDLTYSQVKGMLALLGDGRTAAQLTRQERPGAEPAKTAAREIYYWPATRRVKVEGFRSLEASQFSMPDRPAAKSPLPSSMTPARQ